MKLYVPSDKKFLFKNVKGVPTVQKTPLQKGENFVLGTIQKGGQVEDEEGVLTPLGMSVAEQYAKDWIQGKRNGKLEGLYPELRGLFYDIRVDSALAHRHAD